MPVCNTFIALHFPLGVRFLCVTLLFVTRNRFGRCANLLADAFGSAEEVPSSASQQRPITVVVVKAKPTSAETNGNATKSVPKPDNGDGKTNTNAVSRKTINTVTHGVSAGQSVALRLLVNAANTLRPLGPHPTLAVTLRRMAREWVRMWATSTLFTKKQANLSCATSIVASSETKRDCSKETPALSCKDPKEKLRYLENAATCLAEARQVLSAIVASAEPTEDTLSSLPVTAKKNVVKNDLDGDGSGGADANTKSVGGKSKASGKKSPDKGKKGTKKGGGGGSSGDLTAADDSKTSLASPSVQPAAVSTPLGRALVMAQLEEACVRAMLGRAEGEGRSLEKLKAAADNADGVTPVQRFVDESTG